MTDHDRGAVAAVDVGSNAVRLLVLDGDGRRLTRRIETTRLAACVDRTGVLDDAAIARTLAVLDDYRRDWVERGVGRVRIAATSAVRDAADRDRFVAAVEATTGVALEVIDGDEEAALAFAGATAGVSIDHPVAVVDVGGGSTEVVVGDAAGRLAASVSMQLGCVRVTERDLVHDPVVADDLAAAAASIGSELDRGMDVLARGGVPLAGASSLVAVAGTATTLAALHLGLTAYEEDLIHGTVVPLDALAALTERLVALDAAARSALGPMQPGRGDVIHGGALVLLAVARRAGVDAVVVSERDGLDALAATLLDARV